jgi:tetratricopeptide (TPR) repeat protein
VLTDPSSGKLDLATERNIRAQLQELTLLWSDLQMGLAPQTHKKAVRSEERKVLADAERMFGPSLGLGLAQAQHLDLAFPPQQPQAVWEFCALGRLALARREEAAAARYMQAALDREPLGFVANFYFGVCALRQKRHTQALQAFSFCAGQNPCAECFLLRGKAQAALGSTDLALKDFDRALEKNPELGITYQHRGNLYREMGRLPEAENDWRMARMLCE